MAKMEFDTKYYDDIETQYSNKIRQDLILLFKSLMKSITNNCLEYSVFKSKLYRFVSLKGENNFTNVDAELKKMQNEGLIILESNVIRFTEKGIISFF